MDNDSRSKIREIQKRIEPRRPLSWEEPKVRNFSEDGTVVLATTLNAKVLKFEFAKRRLYLDYVDNYQKINKLTSCLDEAYHLYLDIDPALGDYAPSKIHGHLFFLEQFLNAGDITLILVETTAKWSNKKIKETNEILHEVHFLSHKYGYVLSDLEIIFNEKMIENQLLQLFQECEEIYWKKNIKNHDLTDTGTLLINNSVYKGLAYHLPDNTTRGIFCQFTPKKANKIEVIIDNFDIISSENRTDKLINEIELLIRDHDNLHKDIALKNGLIHIKSKKEIDKFVNSYNKNNKRITTCESSIQNAGARVTGMENRVIGLLIWDARHIYNKNWDEIFKEVDNVLRKTNGVSAKDPSQQDNYNRKLQNIIYPWAHKCITDDFIYPLDEY